MLKKTKPSFWQLCVKREVLVTGMLYSGLCLMLIIYDEVFSLWSVNPPEEGSGLNFSPSEIGIVFAICGVYYALLLIVSTVVAALFFL